MTERNDAHNTPPPGEANDAPPGARRDCELEHLLVPHLDRELDREDERRLRDHLATCPTCAGRREQHREVEDLVEAWATRAAHADRGPWDREKTLAVVAGVRGELRRGRRRLVISIATSLAAVLVVSLSLVGLWLPAPSRNPSGVGGAEPLAAADEESLIIQNLDVLVDLYTEGLAAAEEEGETGGEEGAEDEEDVGLELVTLLAEDVAEGELVGLELFDYILEEEVDPEKL
ncbi:MAG: zf-HC2 domain-containing protein [Planctomycetota bacterium]|nr:zf-HC2 domain-containing protein [Planctomycetota bacterium]